MNEPDAPSPLKLRGEDSEDIEVIASCLQDALVAVADLAYLPEEHRFVLVANRFCWECCRDLSAAEIDRRRDSGHFERVLCGLSFEGVGGVKYRNLRRTDTERVLELLHIAAGEGIVDLYFAGGTTIRLTVDRLSCHLSDLGDRWTTVFRPRHPQTGDMA